jgi:dienelactone hydrolase
MKRAFALIALLALVGCAGTGSGPASIKEEPVTYSDGTNTLRGYIVYDEARKDRRPGMIVVHEWWGVTPHTHNEARRYAEQGYTAFIADMFAGKTADNPKEAGALSGGLIKNPAVMQARFNAARAALARHSTVNASRIGAAGYCMGGTVVINMARAGADVNGVAAFHPSLGGYQPGSAAVKAKVLVLNGADDPFNKPDQIAAVQRDMQSAKADYRFVNYPGAVHAFTNPEATAKGKQFNLPLAYNPEADRRSKAEADTFFRSVLGN